MTAAVAQLRGIRCALSRAYCDRPRTTSSSSAPCPIEPTERMVWTVEEEEWGTRLDRFVKRRAAGLPSGFIQRLIRQGKVTVDDAAPRRNAYSLRAGASVGIPGDVKLGLTRGKKKPPADDTSLAEAAEVRSWVLHRDARCVVLNKPPGVATQAGGPEGERAVEHLLPGIGAGRYWLVHRLDREVGGALVVARDVGAAGLLAAHFRARRVLKEYWALVRGQPLTPSGVISAPVDGKKALTRYTTLQRAADGCTWLKLEPTTGRKHQLRVHCAAALGTPIVGDRRYAEPGLRALSMAPEGLNLHARRIAFPVLTQVHRGGAKPQFAHNDEAKTHVSVEAPLPAHMVKLWRAMGIEMDVDEEVDQLPSSSAQ